MTQAILLYVPTALGCATYVALTIAEGLGAIDPVSIADKFGGAGLVVMAAFFALRWLLKDRERLEKKIDDLQAKSEESRERYQQEIRALLEKKR